MKNLTILLFLIATGCASVHQGEVKSVKGASGSIKKGILVSSEIIPSFSRHGFKLIEFTFENPGKEWVRFDQMKFSSGSVVQDKQSRVVLGRRLATWSEAIRNEMSIEAYNRSMVISGIGAVAAIGAASSASSGNMQGAQTGLGIMAVSSAILSVDQINAAATAAERKAGSKIPDGLAGLPTSHLYAGSIEVPPKMFLRRWILVDFNSASRLTAHNKYRLNFRLESESKSAAFFYSEQCHDSAIMYEEGIKKRSLRRSIKKCEKDMNN